MAILGGWYSRCLTDDKTARLIALLPDEWLVIYKQTE